MTQSGAQFLHERDPNLQKSAEVNAVVDFLHQNGEKIANDPQVRIEAHLGFLANREYANDGILTGDENSINRQIDAHVIKSEDVPESYFELQRRIAREQGHGDITITSEMKGQMVEAVQADQRVGLGKWVEYLGGEDGGYTDWFKTYTYNAITELGSYDKEKGEFLKRSRGTTAAYPELNREALAYVYDVLNKSRVQGEAVDGGANNEQLQKLLKGANFGKLYAHAVLEVTPSSPELLEEIRGAWTKFNKTSDPRTARRLASSLQGHGTGWCTAGESTASSQLSGGDFYVYYTRDEDGKDTVPRVAIRMRDGVVAEVRGINASQELELSMADTTAEQLQELPGGEEYIVKAEDMKRLTAIDKKIATNAEVELTGEELSFLYELDHQIQGFGYDADPRINEIRTKRGERDKPELTKLLPESIREQIKSSFIAYNAVAQQLGETEATQQEFEQLFAQKDEEWQANGVYEEIVERLVKDGVRFNLLATPDVEANEAQIVALAETFGEDQPSSTYGYDEMYRKYRFTAKQLSANTGTSSVKFSLIEANLDPRLASKTAVQQREILARLQVDGPKLNVHIPSLLDAVTNWYALRARGDRLADNTAFNKTFVRHFDLPEQRIDDWSKLPNSYVNDDGGPYLSNSAAAYQYDGRVSVG